MSDLIRREDAIDAIMREPTDAHYPSWYADRIKALPSAEAVKGWIPVSERLPKARESVILSTKECTGEGCCWETTKYHVIWKGYRWNETYWDDEVIAWMPLPPVYQGE